MAARERELRERLDQLSELDRELQTFKSELAARDRDLHARDAEHEVAESSLAARDEQLTRERQVQLAVQERLDAAIAEAESQTKRLAELEEALARRERSVAAKSQELDAAWKTIEQAAIERIEADRFRRKSLLDLRERELDAREAAVARHEAPLLDVALTQAVRYDEPVASSLITLPYLESLVERQADESPEQLDLWRAYLSLLREHVTVSGALPHTFDQLVDEVFGELLEDEQPEPATA